MSTEPDDTPRADLIPYLMNASAAEFDRKVRKATEVHGPEVQCFHPKCKEIQCQPGPWYGSGVYECCASGSCEICRPSFGFGW